MQLEQELMQSPRQPLTISAYEKMRLRAPMARPTLYTVGDLAASIEIVHVHRGNKTIHAFIPVSAHGVIADDSEYCGEDYN